MDSKGILPFLIVMITSRIHHAHPHRKERNLQKSVHQSLASDVDSEIITSRTTAYLSCESGDMVVKINFTEPYHGVAYANDRFSPCRFYGDGKKYYEMRIPLKGCGTKQEKARVFINNILVRFHPSLELEGDEIKTIICRYPPPLAPPPNNIVGPIIYPTTPTIPETQPKLSEIDILIIICTILFISLLILGIGIAYFCLKRRNIHLVRRKQAPSLAPSSQITKLTGSLISEFDSIRIPRATALSTAGSEAILLASSANKSDASTSDYPSETPSSLSSLDDLDTRGSDYHLDSEPVYADIQRKFVQPTYPNHASKIEVRNYDDFFITKTSKTTLTEETINTRKVYDKTNPHPSQWNVMFRILNSPKTIEGMDLLTEKDKELLKDKIVDDGRFRQLIQEATTNRDMDILTKDSCYSHMYNPEKWSVIIRILNSCDRNEWRNVHHSPVPSSRANSIRSLTEIDVNFNHSDGEESISSMPMSRVAQERSTSEYLEVIPVISRRNHSNYSFSEYSAAKNLDSQNSRTVNTNVTRVPSIGERETVKSVTEEHVCDWQK
ncbi:uncharacterized protein LOC111632464 [Centruroides sculpturatus]|uniref:uncharacterized protein LOC111632464 n=1 Tax=Centruroides sculpturatus TaxID=218467 RepID=UPI000C6E2CEA|nr:uncharacterized protein LOC111632464 [Centruroides sculpturatus]